MSNNKSMNDHNKGIEKKLYEMYKDRIDNYSIQQLEILLDVIGLLDSSKEERNAFQNIFATRIGELIQIDICKNYKVEAAETIKKGDRLVTIKCDNCGRLSDTTLKSLENMCKNNDNQILCLYCRKL